MFKWEIVTLIVGALAGLLAFTGWAGALTGTFLFVCIAVFVIALMAVIAMEVNGKGRLT